MFEKINVDKFDVILEDGLHEYNANICFLKMLFNIYLKMAHILLKMYIIKIKLNL